MTRFQTIFLGVLILLGIVGVMLFALVKNNSGQGAPALVMWGTLKSEQVTSLLSEASTRYQKSVNVSYVEKDATTFEDELIAALARGKGPDLALIPQDFILKQQDKFYIVPFDSYSERSFKDAFIPEGELFLTKNGIMGFPLSIDPLVMYWNRTILADAGIPAAPTLWTEFFGIAPKIVKKDGNGNITQSLAAFGEVRNITHAKDIIALLALQAGTPIITYDGQGNAMSAFDMRGPSLVPAEEAVSFFTEFSNPNKPSYSWNRALPNDRNAFVGGKLALYFGYASELQGIRAANPNLDFDVASVPQAAGSKKMTFGRMNAIAVLKSSANVGAAYVAAATLTGSDLQSFWVEKSGFPPVRRDLLTKLPGDAYKSVFYQSALISNAWLDPNREATDGTFMRLIENVTSGKLRVSEAVGQASNEFNNLLRSNI